jgi:hypothetical protein
MASRLFMNDVRSAWNGHDSVYLSLSNFTGMLDARATFNNYTYLTGLHPGPSLDSVVFIRGAHQVVNTCPMNFTAADMTGLGLRFPLNRSKIAEQLLPKLCAEEVDYSFLQVVSLSTAPLTLLLLFRVLVLFLIKPLIGVGESSHPLLPSIDRSPKG